MSEARTQRGSGRTARQALPARASAQADIRLHIQHIVLEEARFTSAQLAQLQSSLEHELTSLLRAGSLPLQGKAEAVLSGPILGPGSTAHGPAHLGQSIARGIYAALSVSAQSGAPLERGRR